MPDLQGYTTVCPDERRHFVDIQEALHYHALANGDGCWRDLLSHAAIEISRLREALTQAQDRGVELDFAAERALEMLQSGRHFDAEDTLERVLGSGS